MGNGRKRSAIVRLWPCGNCEFMTFCIIFSIGLIIWGSATVGIVYLERQIASSAAIPLRGAGSPFAATVYTEWLERLDVLQDVPAYYISSDQKNGTVALLDESDHSSFCGGELASNNETFLQQQGLLQFPTVAASVSIIYHLPDNITDIAPLNVTLDCIAEIFNGSITHWSDERLRALNPLYSDAFANTTQTITPFHFDQPNGATYLITTFFYLFSEPWQSGNYSFGETIKKWPTGTAVETDTDMKSAVQETSGSVGYILYPEMMKINITGISTKDVNIDSASLCLDSTCAHEPLILNATLQSQTMSQFEISNSTGKAYFAGHTVDNSTLITSCDFCWPISGYTYWITRREYYYDNGCGALLKNLEAMLEYAYKNESAQATARENFFFMNQTQTCAVVQYYQSILSCKLDNDEETDGILVLIWSCVLAFCLFLLAGFVVRVSAGIYINYKEEKRNPKKKGFSIQDDEESSTASMEISPLLKNAKIDSEELVLANQIGAGSFGEVYSAVWRGAHVATKRVLVNSKMVGYKTVINDFMKEATLMSRLRHPNIIQFLGASLKPPHLYIVLELASRGSVFDILGRHAITLSWNRRMQFCIDAAAGMLYLHSCKPPIIHRDLKTANLLVDSNWRVKVTDFGMSRVLDKQNTMTHCGTIEFCAPEVLNKSRYSTKADVFSFAICVWQIFSRTTVHANLPLYELMRMVVHDHLRPPVDRIQPVELQELMIQCWADDPDERPEFGTILDALTTIQRDFEDYFE